MSKEDLAKYPLDSSDDLLSELHLPGSYVVGSGGTTAGPKYIFYTHEEFAKLSKNSADCFFANGMAVGDSVVNYVVAGDMWSSFLMVDKALCYLPVTIYPLGYTKKLDYAAQIFEKFKPNVIIGIPTMILEFARYTAEFHPEIQIQKVFYGGEPMTLASMDLLASAWNCAFIRSAGYGSTDVGMIGAQCLHCKPGEHYPFDDTLVEIIGGEIVVTSLFRRAMPMIRYRTGDCGIWVESSCDCARGAPHFKLLGRLDNIMLLWGCRIRYEDIENALLALGVEFMAIQAHILFAEGGDVLSVRFESLLPALGEGVHERLRDRFYESCQDMREVVTRKALDHRLFFEAVPAGALQINSRTGKVVPVIDSRICA